jgi:hypothetical protein
VAPITLQIAITKRWPKSATKRLRVSNASRRHGIHHGRHARSRGWAPGTEDEADDLLLRAAQAALRRGGVPVIPLTSETLGELICEGNRYKSYPDAQWLVPGCFTCKPEGRRHLLLAV